MRFNYFKTIEDKYSCKVSLEKPIIIRLDGKDVTKNPSIDILSTEKKSFSDALKFTAKYLSLKYNCIVICSTDELSCIFLDGNEFKKRFKSNKCQKSSSLLSQEVFLIFNKYYEKSIIFFDARAFNIPRDKIVSYIKYRVISAKNVNITYLSKKAFPYILRKNKKMIQLENMLLNTRFSSILNQEYINKGYIFFNGEIIDTDELLSSDNSEIYNILKKHEKDIDDI